MEQRQNTRTQKTREQLRAAAHQLFLQQGYQGTSIEGILAEAGISSKETFYRHYANKEAIFVDVLRHLTMEMPRFSEKLDTLPSAHDLASLRQVLATLAYEILAMISQPGYLPLIRMIITEMPRFPQLGKLFFSTVTQRGISIITAQLRAAKAQEIIADIDVDAVAYTLLGGLLTYVVMHRLLAGEEAQDSSSDHANAVIEVIMRSLRP
ncbi:TetR/AcrR family transcriptional regulator [Ktedonobacter racemifer]|uniref:Transcriptional regulator, TetR family n=1 Tax=Ktedonobacter racemifer DSM 44963 TaxID=485913 RepID=D6TVQ2_KTERA|nr:TetR/AcrR family transcriptional regulator [Ktedonobacter racemifer]EFH84285.1 transcriptional regulator, TetR family [Ktedonobacter racemifer DSM 44963]